MTGSPGGSVWNHERCLVDSNEVQNDISGARPFRAACQSGGDEAGAAVSTKVRVVCAEEFGRFIVSGRAELQARCLNTACWTGYV